MLKRLYAYITRPFNYQKISTNPREINCLYKLYEHCLSLI